MAATRVWASPYPFHCPSWTRSLRVTHELRGRQPKWLCSEFVPFLLLFDWQEAFHCCLVVTCINRINMISIQCHRVGEWWSGKPEFENVSDPAGVYIPFNNNYKYILFTLDGVTVVLLGTTGGFRGGGRRGRAPPFWNSKEGLQGGPKREHAPCAPPLLKFQRGSSNGTAAAPPPPFHKSWIRPWVPPPEPPPSTPTHPTHLPHEMNVILR